MKIQRRTAPLHTLVASGRGLGMPVALRTKREARGRARGLAARARVARVRVRAQSSVQAGRVGTRVAQGEPPRSIGSSQATKFDCA